MIFNSYIFLLVFLPICLTGYYTLNHFKCFSLAKCYLLAMSLWFYGFFHPSYLLLIICSIAINYLIARRLTANKPKLFLGIGLNLGTLFFFKYYDFFIDNVNQLFGSSLPLLQVLLPLGISFFTFQQIGFLVDTYRGNATTYPFWDYALYVCFFPQLVAGPIVSHHELIPQLQDNSKKQFHPERFSKGCFCFTLGLAKKVLLADIFAKGTNFGYSNIDSLNSLTSIFTIIAYTFEIYFDFSGYSDMARGLAWMFQFELPINFDSPYRELHIVGFWKKWHMTLTRFFTQYLYIPLGGNRKGQFRTYMNYFIVFLLSGLWHGANWTFILWGLMHGCAFIIVRHLLGVYSLHPPKHPLHGIPKLARNSFCWIIEFSFICIAFAIFRATDIHEAFHILHKVFTGGIATGLSSSFVSCFCTDEFWYLLKVLHLANYSFSSLLLCLGYFLIAFVIILIAPNVNTLTKRWKPTIRNAILCSTLFLWCIISFSEVTTFIYYNF